MGVKAGVNGVVKEIGVGKVGVGGVVKTVSEGWCGVNGVVRRVSVNQFIYLKIECDAYDMTTNPSGSVKVEIGDKVRISVVPPIEYLYNWYADGNADCTVKYSGDTGVTVTITGRNPQVVFGY